MPVVLSLQGFSRMMLVPVTAAKNLCVPTTAYQAGCQTRIPHTVCSDPDRTPSLALGNQVSSQPAQGQAADRRGSRQSALLPELTLALSGCSISLDRESVKGPGEAQVPRETTESSGPVAILGVWLYTHTGTHT